MDGSASCPSDARDLDAPAESEKDRRRGGSHTGLVGLLALLLAIGIGVALLTQDDETAAGAATKTVQPADTPGVSTGRPSVTLAQTDSELGRVDRVETPSTEQAVFDGTGTIAGHLFPAPGVELPESWTLVVEPSSMLTGKERAVRRVVERTRDEVEFKITDLPQAGYVVRAEAAGMNSSEVHVLLAKGYEYQYVNLKLSPSGFIDGGLTNTVGEPVDGVAVTLESVADGTRVKTETDLAGNYVFRGVLDGEYTLTFGAPEGPLLPVETLSFRAPSLRVPTREVPHDGVLLVRVTDDQRNPLPDVTLRGWGSLGGVIDTTTDAAGQAKLRFLPEGQFKILASRDDRSTRVSVNVKPATTTNVTLRLGN